MKLSHETQYIYVFWMFEIKHYINLTAERNVVDISEIVAEKLVTFSSFVNPIV